MEVETDLKIGAAARAAGVHVQTLRYYERRGLLPPPRRVGGNYRSYGNDTVQRVRAIKRAQRLGFTLEEIADFDRIRDGDLPPQRLELIVADKVVEIDAKLRDLRLMKRKLRQVVDACTCGGDPRHCDVLLALSGEDRNGNS